MLGNHYITAQIMAGYDEGELTTQEQICLMKRVDPKTIDRMVGEKRHLEIRRLAGLPGRANNANINNSGLTKEVVYRLCLNTKERNTGQKVIDWTQDYLSALRETGEDSVDVYQYEGIIDLEEDILEPEESREYEELEEDLLEESEIEDLESESEQEEVVTPKEERAQTLTPTYSEEKGTD
jgi:hypothetical protein